MMHAHVCIFIIVCMPDRFHQEDAVPSSRWIVAIVGCAISMKRMGMYIGSGLFQPHNVTQLPAIVAVH